VTAHGSLPGALTADGGDGAPLHHALIRQYHCIARLTRGDQQAGFLSDDAHVYVHVLRLSIKSRDADNGTPSGVLCCADNARSVVPLPHDNEQEPYRVMHCLWARTV
jgi:hypothetical protein